MSNTVVSRIDVSFKMTKYVNCILIFFLVAINCNNCDKINTVNQFLVTISGSNLTASEVLVKLKQLLSSLKGKASDIDECRLILDICNKNATCINTLGSYKCDCDDGHAMNGNLSDPCLDIDECQVGIHNCSDYGTCHNLPGSFSCSCNEGYTGDGYKCSDIDECTNTTTSGCQPNSSCVNLPGTFVCKCNDGFMENNITSTCVDIDECGIGVHKCSNYSSCDNVVGSYLWSCNVGFSGDGFSCTDVNECDTNPCDDKATCTNLMGTYSCECDPGFSGNGTDCEDIDECSVNEANNCHGSAKCENLPGLFLCHCGDGYHGNGTECEDIDECESDQHNCSTAGTCINLPGSYNCTCNAGFSGDGINCEDIDECNSKPCHENADCTNTEGSFECECLKGFFLDGQVCQDVNECDTSPCHYTATCINLLGTFACQCKTGFKGNGTNCQDIDECGTNPCDDNATCRNKIGSYSCDCMEGFYGNGTHCKDSDECLTLQPCHVYASCSNLIGSFSCSCLTGFTGDGINCTDINECSDDDLLCEDNAKCVNELGSYTCECKLGFEKQNGSCQDVDECNLGSDSCDLTTQVCINNEGSYACQCRQDLRWDGNECRPPPNECAMGTHDCHPLATCIHEGPTYSCVCNETSYDNNSKGRNCVSPIKVSCTSRGISVEVVAEYYKMKHIGLSDLHLADRSCVGVKSSSSESHWIFEIDDLTSCGTVVRKNRTHVTYSNVLSNSVESGVYLGTFVSVPFSCSYLSNITVALPTPYVPQTNVISISGPNGTGTFVVEMHLHTDSTYTKISNETVYATTDTLYVQVKLTADDERLILLINECWATPSSSGSDPNGYTFIDNGCPIPGGVADTVRVTSNGQGKTAHFQSQVFGFVDYNTTYLHCTVDLCAQHHGQDCQRSCNRTRRSVLPLMRKRRSAEIQFLSLGPFVSGKRSTFSNHIDGFFSRHFSTIISAFVSAVVLMICLVLYVVVSGQRLQLRILRRFNGEIPANKHDRVRSGSNATAIRNLHAVMASDEVEAGKCREHTGGGTSSFECSRV